MCAVDEAGQSPFGAIDQRIVRAHIPWADDPAGAPH